MKHFFTLLLAVMCLTHLASTGRRNRNKGDKRFGKLEDKLEAMEAKVASLMKCAKETKAGFEELGEKVDKMLMLFAKKFPKLFCAFCPNWKYFDGCNWCWCYQGMVVCTRRYCGPFSDVCKLPKVIGRCRARIPKYYYDYKERRCMKFYYGGCGGNDNNFKNLEECQKTCGGNGGNMCPADSNPLGGDTPQTCSISGKKPCPEGFFCHTTGVCCSNRGCPPVISNKLCIRQGSCQRRDGRPGCDAGLICCPDSPSCGTACMKPVTGCYYNGNFYKPGASFPAIDGCNKCFCLPCGIGSSGITVACTLKHCEGCLHNGCRYKVGEPIPPDDGCNRCFCGENGAIGCTKIGCPQETKCPKTFPIPLPKPGTYVRQCSKSLDCPKGKICCARNCHHVCVDVTPPTDLVCPTLPPGTVGTCDERCGLGCKSGTLCCSNGCGHLCKKGVKPNSKCPKYKRQCLLPSTEFCGGNCKKGEECCPDGCGGSVCTSLPPAVAPCSGGPVQMRVDGTPFECSDGHCPAQDGYCDFSTNICCR